MALRTVSNTGGGDYVDLAPAFAACNPGDEVRIINSGTYTGNYSCAVSGVSLTAAAGCTPIVTVAAGRLLQFSDNQSVIGYSPTCRITLRVTGGSGGFVNYGAATDPRIENCDLVATGGADLYGIWGGACTGTVTVKNCTFTGAAAVSRCVSFNRPATGGFQITDCTATTTYPAAAFVYCADANFSGTISRNQVRGAVLLYHAWTATLKAASTISANHLYYDDATCAGGAAINLNCDSLVLRVWNNTVVGAGAAVYGNASGILLNAASAADVRNNIVYHFKYCLDHSAGLGYTATNCDLWDASSARSHGLAVIGAGCLNADPLLTTPATDETLQAGSTCIMAGVDTGELLDRVGTAWPVGARDMGSRKSTTPLPEIVSATCTDATHVAVLFNLAPSGAGTTLPGGWTITSLGGGLPVTVLAVSTLGLTCTLTTAAHLPSHPYRVDVSTITDAFGNPIVVNSALYTSAPPAPVAYTSDPYARTIPAIVYACDLAGVPIDGFSPMHLVPEDPGDDDLTLANLLLVCLLSDRLAQPSDPVSGEPADRRGWWADDDGDSTGSRLWLLPGQPILPTITRDAESYAREACACLIEDGVVGSVEVEAELHGEALYLGVTAVRGDGTGVRLTLPDLWAVYGG